MIELGFKSVAYSVISALSTTKIIAVTVKNGLKAPLAQSIMIPKTVLRVPSWGTGTKKRKIPNNDGIKKRIISAVLYLRFDASIYQHP